MDTKWLPILQTTHKIEFMRQKNFIAICVAALALVSIFVVGLTTALNDEPTSKMVCRLNVFNNDVMVSVVTPQLMFNDFALKVDVNDTMSYTCVGYDSLQSIYFNVDTLCLVVTNSLHLSKVDTIILPLNNPNLESRQINAMP